MLFVTLGGGDTETCHWPFIRYRAMARASIRISKHVRLIDTRNSVFLAFNLLTPYGDNNMTPGTLSSRMQPKHMNQF